MGFFEDSYISAKSLFDTAVKKAGDSIEIQKIRIEIAKLQSAITSDYSKLGELYYAELKGAQKDEEAVNTVVSEIELKKQKLEEQNVKLAEARNSIVCEKCGRANSYDARFCSGCGSEINK